MARDGARWGGEVTRRDGTLWRRDEAHRRCKAAACGAVEAAWRALLERAAAEQTTVERALRFEEGQRRPRVVILWHARV
eukprot:1386859-Prymnesium_polylepis.1